MKMKVGLWIDHREAIAVLLREGGEEVRHFRAENEKLAHSPTTAHAEPQDRLLQRAPEDLLDRKVEHSLHKYYDEIIGGMREAESIHIFGPGEAKREFEKRAIAQGLKERIAGMESADRMTDRQFLAKIKEIYTAPPARMKPRK